MILAHSDKIDNSTNHVICKKLDVTDEIGDRIDKLFIDEGKDVNVTVMSAMGEEVAVEAKEGPKGA